MATALESTRLLTIEDLDALPDDGIQYELVDGRLVPLFLDDDGTPMSGTTIWHGFVSAALVEAVRSHVMAHRLGVVLSEGTAVILQRGPDVMRCPDCTYVSWDRLPGGDIPRGRLTTIPDFVAETLSPNDRASEVRAKIEQYLDAGVRLVWLADPETRTVTSYAPGGAAHVHHTPDTLDGGDVIPGLRVPVAPLFAFERPAPIA